MDTSFTSVCGGKSNQYDTKHDARNGANASRARYGGRWTIYRCPFGNHWHAGHVVRETGDRNRRAKGRSKLRAAA